MMRSLSGGNLSLEQYFKKGDFCHNYPIYTDNNDNLMVDRIVLFEHLAEELKEVISFDNGDGPDSQSAGDLYNNGTVQVIIFQPQTLSLEIYFKPVAGLDDDPVFENVVISF